MPYPHGSAEQLVVFRHRISPPLNRYSDPHPEKQASGSLRNGSAHNVVLFMLRL